MQKNCWMSANNTDPDQMPHSVASDLFFTVYSGPSIRFQYPKFNPDNSEPGYALPLQTAPDQLASSDLDLLCLLLSTVFDLITAQAHEQSSNSDTSLHITISVFFVYKGIC